MARVSGGLTNTSASFQQQGSTGILTGQSIQIPPTRLQCNLQPGTSTDQVDGLYANLIPFSAATPQTIDLATLVDVQGNAITAARARFIALKNLSVVDNDYFTVGDAAGSDEFDGFLSAAGTIKVFPSSGTAGNPTNDGFLVLSAPGVTGIPIGGSSYNLKIDPGALAKSLIILIATCSA